MKGLDLHEHAGAATKGRIVHGAMAIMRPIAQIVRGKIEQAARTGAAHDRRGHIGFEKLGKDREGLDEHEHSSQRLEIEQTVHDVDGDGPLFGQLDDDLVDNGHEDLPAR